MAIIIANNEIYLLSFDVLVEAMSIRRMAPWVSVKYLAPLDVKYLPNGKCEIFGLRRM